MHKIYKLLFSFFLLFTFLFVNSCGGEETPIVKVVPPSGLEVKYLKDSNHFSFRWNSQDGSDSYYISWKKSGPNSWGKEYPATGSSEEMYVKDYSSLIFGERYQFRMRSSKDGKFSSYTTTGYIQAGDGVKTPMNMEVYPFENHFDISWDNNSDTNQKYYISWKKSGDEWGSEIITSKSRNSIGKGEISDLKAGDSYKFRVRSKKFDIYSDYIESDYKKLLTF